MVEPVRGRRSSRIQPIATESRITSIDKLTLPKTSKSTTLTVAEQKKAQNLLQNADAKSVFYTVGSTILRALAALGGGLVVTVGVIAVASAVILAKAAIIAIPIGLLITAIGFIGKNPISGLGAAITIGGGAGVLAAFILSKVSKCSAIIAKGLLERSEFVSEEAIEQITAALSHDPTPEAFAALKKISQIKSTFK